MNLEALDIPRLVRDAEARIRPYVRRTELLYSDAYSRELGADVHFKCENLQHTGSFKVRGALNRILSLDDEARRRGVVAASTGNHGKAVAFALREVGARGIVFVPQGASEAKLEAIRALGAEVRFEGADSIESERFARAYADREGMTYVSPYNDPLVVGGQGTIGLELLDQLERIDVVFASLGGGGLLSGVAGYLKARKPAIEIVGCSPSNSRVMIESVRAGAVLELHSEPTLSDGTAGGIETGAITFEPCARLIDDFVTVDELLIRDTLRAFTAHHPLVIEGSAAVAAAGCLAHRERLANRSVAVVLCGGNIALDTLAEVLGEPVSHLERSS